MKTVELAVLILITGGLLYPIERGAGQLASTTPSGTPAVQPVSPAPQTSPEKKGEMDVGLGLAPEGKITSPITDDWLNAVVSIEIVSGEKPIPIGTGFLIVTEKDHVILVTAKHVITGGTEKVVEDLGYRFNNTERGSNLVREGDFSRSTGTWFLSEKADLACRYISWKPNNVIKGIPVNMLLRQKYLRAGAPVLVFGFPIGLRSEQHPTAIARRGTVARSDTDGLMLDAFMFPGNSGGPVFYMPTFSVDDVFLKSPYLNAPRLIGLVTSYVPYTDVAVSAQTKRPRITFEENSGLSNTVTADELIDLLGRPEIVKLDGELPPAPQ